MNTTIMLKHFKKFLNGIDIEEGKIEEWFVKSADFTDKMFHTKDKAIELVKDGVSSKVEDIKELWSNSDLIENPIDIIRNPDVFFDYQFDWSNRAKDVFAPFFSDGESSLVMDYIESAGQNDISFAGICSPSGIELDFEKIDSSIFEMFEASDNIDYSEIIDSAIDLVSDTFDTVDVASTFGLSLIAGWGIKKIFKKKHDKKEGTILELAKQITPKMKLLSCIRKNVAIEEAYPFYKSVIRI